MPCFRKYDYKRALCKDPELICGWLALVRNTIVKYGVAESDIYNFNEPGFMMGIISTGMVVTSADQHSNTKLSQPGGCKWVTVIQGINSQGWTIPPFIIVAGKFLALLRFCISVYIRSADVTVINATEAYASLTCVTCLLMCIRPCLLETPVCS